VKPDVNGAPRARSGIPPTPQSGVQSTSSSATGVNYGPLPTLVGHHIRKAYSHLFETFTEALGEFGLAPGQYSVLALIGLNPGLSQMALADAAGIDATTMVPITERFAKAGWVRRTRRPEDRRVYSLRLTPQGEAILRKAGPLVEAYERKLTAALSSAERAKVRELLARIADIETADERSSAGTAPAAKSSGRARSPRRGVGRQRRPRVG
jgi:DNA-binding MarR family transcriptional regulator